MTKLIHCQNCGDIFQPHPDRMVPRWCRCKRHAIWWTREGPGYVNVYDIQRGMERWQPGCFVMGLLNSFLWIDREDGATEISATAVAETIKAAPQTYKIFKDWNSPIVKSRVGTIPQIQYANKLPKEKKVKRRHG
jgi:hypothetical protein